MRRVLLLATVGLFALPVAACADNSTEPNTPATSAPASAAGNAAEVCRDIEGAIDESSLQPLGAAIGEYIVYREQGMSAETAQAETKIKGQITEIAAKFTAAAEKADDPALKQKLNNAAAQVTQATDLKFLENVKSVEDIEGPLATLLAGWFMPIATICETT